MIKYNTITVNSHDKSMIGNYLTYETGSHKKQNSDREPQPFAPTSGSNEILQISIVHNTFWVT